ncbi:MAG: xylulose kinase [Proteobacteria bacterium]|nr:xylulose kinase [Pseudomonadota bacterium]
MQENQTSPQSSPEASVYVLVIDLGSSGIKGALVSDTGDVVARAFEQNDTQLFPKGGAEQDARLWWANVKKVAKEVIRESKVPPEKIEAVCCDSQYSVVVPIDEHGEPLMNAVHWLDQRGAPYNHEISKGFPSVQGYGLGKILKWIRLTGMAPMKSGLDSLGHILYIKNELPDIYKKTYKFVEPMDYLTARLTGRITASQHTVVMMMVASNREWGLREYNDQLMKLGGVDKEKFPELLPNGGVIGPLCPAVAEELGLSPSTRVISGIMDNQAASIGAGVVDDFDGLLIVATTLSLNGHVPFKKTDINTSIASVPSCLKDKYVLLCEQGLGGKCIEYYLKNFVYPEDEFNLGSMPEDAYERLNRIAEEVPPGSDGILFLPWLNGAITPVQNPTARGGFFNLSLNSTRSQMTRSVMEGVAFCSRSALRPLEKFMGRKLDHLKFAGGGALSDVWSQIYADIMEIPIHQVADPVDATCRGAALNGLVVLGRLTLDQIPGLINVKRIYEPIASNRAVYRKMYSQFRAVFKNNRKVFAALNSE